MMCGMATSDHPLGILQHMQPLSVRLIAASAVQGSSVFLARLHAWASNLVGPGEAVHHGDHSSCDQHISGCSPVASELTPSLSHTT